MSEGEREVDLIDFLPEAVLFYRAQFTRDQVFHFPAFRPFIIKKTFKLVAGTMVLLKKLMQGFSRSGGANDDDASFVEARKFEIFQDQFVQYSGTDDEQGCEYIYRDEELCLYGKNLECRQDREYHQHVNQKSCQQVNADVSYQTDGVYPVDF